MSLKGIIYQSLASLVAMGLLALFKRPKLALVLVPLVLLLLLGNIARFVNHMRSLSAQLELDDTPTMASAGPMSVSEVMAEPVRTASVKDFLDPEHGQAVLLVSQDKPDYGLLGRCLGEVTGVVPFDASRALRTTPGNLLIDALRPDIATKFLASLTEQGIQAISIPSKELFSVGKAIRLKRVEVQDDALVMVGHRQGETVAVEVAELLLIHPGQVRYETTRVKVENDNQRKSGMGMGRGKAQTRTVTEHESKVLIDAFFRTGERQCQRFRMGEGQMSFAHLGDDKQQTALNNLRLTIRQWQGKAPKLFANANLQRFLEGGMPPTYRNEKAFDGTAIGLLQLARATELIKSGAVGI